MNLKSLQELVWIAFFTALMAVSAFIALPIGPVPFTMQVLTLYLASFLLGSKRAIIVVLLYLLLGALGFPFFSGGKSGLATLFGPTGGFLISWIPVAFIAGSIQTKKIFSSNDEQSLYKKVTYYVSTALMLLFSLVVLYGIGGAWLMYSIDVTWQKAFALACAPFILPDLIKIGIAYFVYQVLRQKVKIEQFQ